MTRSCPVCKKSIQADYTPFCSKRCADIDLGNWLKGSYVIPGVPEDAISLEVSVDVIDDKN